MFENINGISDDIGNERNYYFLRTSGGKHFNAFHSGNYVGINWNYITTQDLREMSEPQIRDKIARLEPNKNNGIGYDLATTEGKKKVTGIYNKISKFRALRKGDIIVMPSYGSHFLAFGYITDNQIFNNFDDNECDWHKRRSVNWVTVEELSNLDPNFYKIVYPKHTISNLNDYARFIDKVMSSAFVKDDVSHLVFNIRDNRDIDDIALANLMSDIKNLTTILNNELNLDDLNQSSVRLNVQSPGTIEFLYKHSKSLILVGFFLAAPLFVSCSNTRGENAQNGTLEQIEDERRNNLRIIEDTINSSNLNRPEKDTLVELATVHYDSIANTHKGMETLGARVERLNQIE